MKDFKLKIGKVTYSCNSSSPLNVHIEHDKGDYDNVEVPFSFDSQTQFEDYIISLDIEYWSKKTND